MFFDYVPGRYHLNIKARIADCIDADKLINWMTKQTSKKHDCMINSLYQISLKYIFVLKLYLSTATVQLNINYS